jgi:FG-GAP-like repeat
VNINGKRKFAELCRFGITCLAGLLIVQLATGELVVSQAKAQTVVGAGFNFTHYFVADWTADGTPDLIVRDNRGALKLYPYMNGTFHGSGQQVGAGFNFTHYFVADWTADGTPDLIGRDYAGTLRLYPFKDGTFPPTAQLTANPTSIQAGASSRLTWSSTNASGCTGTNFSTGGSTSGNASVAPAYTTTYTIICTNAAGSANASVTVTFRPPTARLSAKPNSIYADEWTRLEWSSTSVDRCDGTNFSTGGATSGRLSVQPGVTTSYQIDCFQRGEWAATALAVVDVWPLPDTENPQCQVESTQAVGVIGAEVRPIRTTGDRFVRACEPFQVIWTYRNFGNKMAAPPARAPKLQIDENPADSVRQLFTPVTVDIPWSSLAPCAVETKSQRFEGIRPDNDERRGTFRATFKDVPVTTQTSQVQFGSAGTVQTAADWGEALEALS